MKSCREQQNLRQQLQQFQKSLRLTLNLPNHNLATFRTVEEWQKSHRDWAIEIR